MIPSGNIYTTSHRSLYLTSFKIVVAIAAAEGGAQKLIHTYIDLLQQAWSY
jgi:hypothetical protein